MAGPATTIRCMRPDSGLTTALDPLMRACGGVWVGHGSGAADRAVVDDRDRVMVPPEQPSYTLRRVWLSKREEQGYYYGFSNEALWPLCHIAYTRPRFDSVDWELYKSVNQKFAGAWLEDKGLGFTVHFRHTPSQWIEMLRARVRETLKPFSSALHTDEGPMALEVTADLGWNKGTAVAKIVRHLRAPDAMVLYAGDSANDVEGLRTTAALGGLGIVIGPDASPVARFRLRAPGELHELLGNLERELNVAARPANVNPSFLRQRTA